jgi:glucokinase
MQKTYLGIEIGGTKLQLVVGDASAHIIERKRFAVEPERGSDGIREQIHAGLSELIPQHFPAAIGVGFGGPVDFASGEVCQSHQVEGWSDFPLRHWLSLLADLPVVVENDANVAALGEAHLGAGVGFNPVFYVTQGSGVGGGLVVNGQIYHGARPGEAEIGHLRLDRQGATVESRCSGWAVDERIRTLQHTAPQSLLAKLIAAAGPGGEARHLPAALRLGDPGARRLLQETAQDFAFALSHVVHLFHPEVIVLGGGLSLIGDTWRNAVAASVRPFLMEAFAPGPAVRLAALGEDAVPTGALLLAQSVATAEAAPAEASVPAQPVE